MPVFAFYRDHSMSTANHVLAVNNDLPIRIAGPVHSGKVRSVYWLTDADSKRLIADKGYDLRDDSPLAVMVISDRISAFDCIWHGEGGLHGVPGKGAALNAIANHWFSRFREQGLADSHIVDIPHPFVEESLELFKDLPDAEKAKITFIHFNHTNPLILNSTQRKQVENLGFNVAFEGMRIDL